MSQAPPAYALPPPQPVSKNNGWAIASLIFGIIGCIPFLSGILAVIFGIVGIKKSPQSGGKGLAITGLILGILSFLGWAGFVTVGGLGTLAMYRASAQPRAVAKQFAQDLSAGNVDAALGRCDPAMKREDVQTPAICFSNLARSRTRWFSVSMDQVPMALRNGRSSEAWFSTRAPRNIPPRL